MARRKIEPGSYRVYLIYEKGKYISDFRCYVGFTKFLAEDRLLDHFHESIYSNKKTKKLNWLRKVSKENIHLSVLMDNIPTIEEAANHEVYFIKYWKELVGNKCIKNGDNGGFGGTKNYTEEVIEKIRQSKIGNTWNRGRKRSKETGFKISKGLTGIKRTDEHKKKVSNFCKERFSKEPAIGSKKVYQYELSGEFIRNYDSIAKANIAISGKSNTRSIRAVLSGESKTAFGYQWVNEYKGDKIESIRKNSQENRIGKKYKLNKCN